MHLNILANIQCLLTSGFTCCLQALAGKKRPSDPGGCLVRLWAGRSSSRRRTSCTSENDTCCDGSLHISPGSNTHRSELAEARKWKGGGRIDYISNIRLKVTRAFTNSNWAGYNEEYCNILNHQHNNQHNNPLK